MLDAVVSLESAGFKGHMQAVSRRGALTDPRRDVDPAAAFLGDDVRSLHGLVRRVQEERRRLATDGEDWQRPVPAVREATPRLWTRLDAGEQQRFVRHLQGVWRSCVHLAPLETHRLAERLREEGRLVLEQGHLTGLAPGPDGRIAARLAGPSGPERTLTGDLVVNCLGHSADWSELGDPLVRALLERGLARRHATGLGIDVDPATHAVIAKGGGTSGRLFAIGHPLRGAVWESSSIAEIADQARTLAAAFSAVADEVRRPGGAHEERCLVGAAAAAPRA
jgi:uncharacterized NAD(P)/FAD-binding protein YdhS